MAVVTGEWRGAILIEDIPLVVAELDPIPAIDVGLRRRGNRSLLKKRSVIKLAWAPGSMSRRARCGVPLTSITEARAVPSSTVFGEVTERDCGGDGRPRQWRGTF